MAFLAQLADSDWNCTIHLLSDTAAICANKNVILAEVKSGVDPSPVELRESQRSVLPAVTRGIRMCALRLTPLFRHPHHRIGMDRHSSRCAASLAEPARLASVHEHGVRVRRKASPPSCGSGTALSA
jgi:hypothetical protein